MERKQPNRLVTQWTRRYASDEVTIELAPLYQDVEPNNDHELYFQWRNDEEQSAYFDPFHRETSVTFSRRFDCANNAYLWTNLDAIDVSGLPSLHRILVIRDMTTQLRDLDEQSGDDNKILTGNARTTITFKLDDTLFSLRMHPTRDQPGNARLTMQGSDGGHYEASHWAVEKFDCFDKLDAKEIDSIVTRAREEGRQIDENDIDINGPYEMKETLAEEMTFFMLLYDFEVARRLQRPFVNNSRYLDLLPIGTGIAMIHRINRQREGQRWIFFSDLFRGSSQSRERALDDIFDELVSHNDPIDLPGSVDFTDALLREQFAAA